MMTGYGNHKNTAFQHLSASCQDHPIDRSNRLSANQMKSTGVACVVFANRGPERGSSPPVSGKRGTSTMTAQRMTAVSSLSIQPESVAATGAKLKSLGLTVARYALVLVLVWIGAMKFTAYEAGAIQPLVANSPLMSWLAIRGPALAARRRVTYCSHASVLSSTASPPGRAAGALRPHVDELALRHPAAVHVLIGEDVARLGEQRRGAEIVGVAGRRRRASRCRGSASAGSDGAATASLGT